MLRATVYDRLAHGQSDVRYFDKLLAGAIPPFNPVNPLHTALATAGQRAEAIAAQVPLKEGIYFTTARRQIRHALADDGVAAEVDSLVDELLRPATR